LILLACFSWREYCLAFNYRHDVTLKQIQEDRTMKVRQLSRRFFARAAAVAAMLLFVAPAMAGQIFYFSFSGATVSGNGTLEANSNGDGSFTAVSGSGIQNVDGTTDTLTLVFNPNGKFVSDSPGGTLQFDNQLFPQNDPMLSDAGLLFTTSSEEVNVFSNIGGGYEYVSDNGFGEMVRFVLSDKAFETVPEPTSILLLGISVVCLVASRRKQYGIATT
jgi:hypothetical protein